MDRVKNPRERRILALSVGILMVLMYSMGRSDQSCAQAQGASADHTVTPPGGADGPGGGAGSPDATSGDDVASDSPGEPPSADGASAEPVDPSPRRVARHAAPAVANLGASSVHTQVTRGARRDLEVAVWVDVPEGADAGRSRPPMAVSLVVDTSGSMGGAKIDNARTAALRLVRSMRDGDIVSLVSFDSRARTLLAPTTLTPETRVSAEQMIRRLRAGGNTALYSGLSTGLSLLRAAPSTHPVRRAFLMSDGYANVGPTDRRSLTFLASQALAADTHVTGLGVGAEYDDETLGAIVVQSAGRLYHLRHTEMLAEIVAEEIEALSHTVATNARIEFAAADGVTVLGGMTLGSTVSRGVFTSRIGTLYGGRSAEVMLRVLVRADEVGVRPLGTARLYYETPDAAREVRVLNHPIEVVVTEDQAAAQASLHPRAHAIASAYHMLERNRRASEYLAMGDNVAAARELDLAADELERSAEAVNDPTARRRIRRRAGAVRRRARVSQMSNRPADRQHTRRELLQDAFRTNAF